MEVFVLQGIVPVTEVGILQIRRTVAEKCSGYIHLNVKAAAQATPDIAAEESQYRRVTTSSYGTLSRTEMDGG